MKEIKEGQVWATKQGKEPITIDGIDGIDGWVLYEWYEKDGKFNFSECTSNFFKETFEFVADSMSEEKFKQWCITGKKPVIKDCLNADDEVIEQSPPIGQKYDTDKPRFSLLPSQIWQVIDVLEFGAKKYGVDNWQQVDNAKERYFNACHRHLYAWQNGERLDSESGLPHLAHAVCCLLFLMWGDDD